MINIFTNQKAVAKNDQKAVAKMKFVNILKMKKSSFLI